MKKPDEIKKALECCFHESEQCADCPYYPVSCDRELVRDAREYIRQLETDNARQHENIRVLELSQQAINATNIEQEHKIWQLEAERDAAVADIRLAFTSYVGTCQTCKHGENQADCIEPLRCGNCENEKCKCQSCDSYDSNWEWRGVQKEE